MTQTIEHQLTIPSDYAGKRVDQALAQLLSDYSRNQIKAWLEDGSITVDQQTVRPKYKVAGYETVYLQAQLAVETALQPEAMSLDIVFEDESLLIINKPAGLVVHPGAGNPNGTLINGLLHHCPQLEHLPRAGLIHRLDKDTTGLLLVGKTHQAVTDLTQQLQNRQIKREYRAIAQGNFIAGGSVEQPIGRHPKSRQKMTVHPLGKPATTHFRVLNHFRHHTYLKIMLETGRTHQIRVHFAYLRHPLVGDNTYGKLYIPPRCQPDLHQTLMDFDRQALHAKRIEFRHPQTQATCQWDAPTPQDMQHLLDVLTQDSEKLEDDDSNVFYCP